MNLVVTILIGLGMGVMVELLLPGHTLSELLLAVFLGIAGALLVRYIGGITGWFGTEQPESFVASALGAIVVLILYGTLFRRGKRRAGK
jgi:uncharacterized membrane protein YeaQ/YmgE (transglycosylase-associated protein family)